MKRLLLSLCLSTILYSNEIIEAPSSIVPNINTSILDLDYLKSLDKGNTRDFYINEYLKKDIIPNEAYETLSLIDDMRDELFYNFARKFKDDETLAVAQCMNMDTRDLVESYSDCMVAGLSIKDISTLSAIDLDLIKQKTSGKYPAFTKRLKILSSSIPFTKLIVQKKDEFYNLFFNVNDTFRTKYFNYKLPKRTLAKIFKDKKKFDEFLRVSLSNPKLNMIHSSFLDIDDTELSVNSSFLLGLNAIRLNDLTKGTKYLNNAILKSNDPVFVSKINFWQYQISKDETILIELSNNQNLNFYTLLANEMLNKVIDTREYLQKTELFDNQLNSYDKKRVALLYAIAKSESSFESKLISEDFKIGMMQLKPSMVKSISTALNKEYNILKQQEDNESLNFANIHLNNLENSFKNPLFLSLAYDGKAELLNWNLKNGIFKMKNSFEPFVSLEFLLNEKLESKKDLLVNYVLYHNLLTKKKKEKITLLSICQKLIEPDQK